MLRPVELQAFKYCSDAFFDSFSAKENNENLFIQGQKGKYWIKETGLTTHQIKKPRGLNYL